MKNIYLLSCALFLIFSCSKEQSDVSNLKDTELNLVTYDKLKRDKDIEIAFDYFKDKKFEKFYQKSKEIEQQSVRANDTLGIVSANVNIGCYFLNTQLNDSAYYYLNKAERLSMKTKSKPMMEYIFQYKSNVLWSQRNFTAAEALAIKALKIGKHKKNYNLIYDCYITLGNSLYGLNDFPKAIEYYQKSVETAHHLKSDPNYLIFRLQSLNYISKVYQKSEEYKKSIIFAEQGLKFKDVSTTHPLIYCYLTNNLAYSKFKLGDKTSLHQFQETLRIGDSLKSIPIQITSKTYLGEFHLAEKDTIKANFYFKDAQMVAHKNNVFDDELKIIKLLAEANPKGKAFYFDRYIFLNDSLQHVERATQNKFARIEFETDEITTERDSLTIEKQNLLMQQWLIAGVSVFSLLSIFLWFKNKSQKSKTRELLLKQEQQKANEEIYQLMLRQQQQMEEGKNVEKQRISLELHDGVMGKLSAVRLNLYASLYKVNLLNDNSISAQIDEIQAVEKEIRNIAHDLSTNLFSGNSNFIEIVRALFKKIENHSEIQFELQVSEAVNWDLINTLIKINLYRILQEALQNIEKYADAKKVAVTMDLTDSNEINVTIADDGNGFDTSQKKSGIGHANMKIRMEELNGKFLIESQISKGTKINLIIPV